MKKKILMAIILLTFSTSFCGNAKRAEIDWQPLEKAMSLSKDNEKPLYIYLYSTHCGWCRKFVKMTLSDSTVISMLSDGFIVSRLNTSSTKKQPFKGKKRTERQLASMFAVRGVPSSIFMDAEGNIITKLPGFMPPDVFRSVLKYIGEKWYKDMTYQEFLESEQKLKEKK